MSEINKTKNADKTTNTASPRTKNADKTTNTAPHRIVNWVAMQQTVNAGLGKCNVCKTKGMKLVEVSRISLASTFELQCETCNNKKEKLRQHLYYLQKKFESEKTRDTYQKIANEKAKLEKLKHKLDIKRVHPVPNKKFKTGRGNQSYTLEYELNIRAMMSAFYIGTGGFDIGELVGMFGIPGGAGWERQHSRHTPFLNQIIIDLAEKMMKESLHREIDATIRDKLGNLGYTEEAVTRAINAWHEKRLEDIPTEILVLGITISFDMGWQKRSTGKVFDSLSGHAYKIGCHTNEIIGLAVKCKKYTKCRKANRLGTVAADHICTINWVGASGAMEAGVALEMVTAFTNESGGRLFIECLVSDDDSSLRKHLRHTENGGKLAAHVRELSFLADPSHRIKTMCSPIYKMITDTKDPSKCKKIDFLRVKKYTSCYIYQNRN